MNGAAEPNRPACIAFFACAITYQPPYRVDTGVHPT